MKLEIGANQNCPELSQVLSKVNNEHVCDGLEEMLLNILLYLLILLSYEREKKESHFGIQDFTSFQDIYSMMIKSMGARATLLGLDCWICHLLVG